MRTEEVIATQPAATASAAPQSVERIFSVLDAVVASPGGVRLADLARVTGAPKTSLVGLLAGMVDGGQLRRDAEGRYFLGPRIFSLAMRVVGSLDLAALARPVLEWLSDETGETVLLGALAPSGDVAIYIDKVESRSSLRYTVSLGEQRELYCTAIGKMMLAHMPAAKQNAYLESVDLQAFTRRTLTDLGSLRKELGAIRAGGLAHTHGERVVGADAVAAPVHGFQQEVLAAIVVAGPSERMREGRAHHETCLMEAARRLSESMAARAVQAA